MSNAINERLWLFWDCFHGHTKGPEIFWKKDKGSIGKETYLAHTAPVIHGYIELLRRGLIELFLMQNGAPGPAAADTREDFRERSIIIIFWPPFSPDLNSIERVWQIIKNYIQNHYSEVMSYDKLRIAVKDAWDKIREHEF